uniref:Signaling lymphocytic activation molecule-like n=1 Tax=Dromaius novaehollandiae TaxID=8790 RepID=A0A8C4K3G2_DRONO
MDRGTCLWLLSSFCVWGASRGARETVLGTLGKATFLRIPPPFQELTARFGAAVWKRDTEDPHSKQVLLKYSDGNYINYMQEQTRFHQANFSLEILNTSRQDRQLYEYIVSKEREEKVWQIQLEVYEPVSAPRIQVLGGTEANDSLTVTLNCTAERGDRVSYSWAGASRLCARNGSVLHLSYSPRNASLACSCTCTAANPVSRRAVAFNASECGREPQGGAGLRTGHLVLVLVVPVVAAGALAAGCTALRAGECPPRPPGHGSPRWEQTGRGETEPPRQAPGP